IAAAVQAAQRQQLIRPLRFQHQSPWHADALITQSALKVLDTSFDRILTTTVLPPDDAAVKSEPYVEVGIEVFHTYTRLRRGEVHEEEAPPNALSCWRGFESKLFDVVERRPQHAFVGVTVLCTV